MTRLRGVLLVIAAAPGAAVAQNEGEELPAAGEAPPAGEAAVPDPFAPAAEPPTPAPTYMVTDRTYTTVTRETQRMRLSELGFAISAGGGVSGFTSDTARSTTQDGGGWDVRATIGTRMPVAAELSYVGSAQTIDALGLDDNAVLIGNGLQANLRLNLTTRAALQPYLFAGAAWRRYDLANIDTNTSAIAGDDDVLEIPVGAGLAYRYAGLVFDARGEFRGATGADLMPSLTQDSPFANDKRAALHRWGVNASIGLEF